MDTPTEIILRPVEAADLDIFFENNRDPEAVRMAAFTAKDPDDRAAFDAHWSRILADPGVLIRAIVADGQVAGSVLKYEIAGEPEVSYWLGREFWGRGIASRALALFLEEFTQRPAFGRAAADNLASLRVLEKCGFVRVGEEKGYANARGEEIVEVVMRLG
ncbi:MAG: GNAT family N-acetyltransferase [Chloroflexi bacterium]|nr:GNAT family N-acetyltransferase [Chloroflexota bacterium]